MTRPAALPSPHPGSSSRRRFLRIAGALGAGGAVFGRALAALAEAAPAGAALTVEQIHQAEWVAGVELSEEERTLMLEGVKELLEDFRKIREVPLDNAVPPALRFELASGPPPPASARDRIIPTYTAASARPSTEEDLAYAPVTELAALLRTRKVSSTAFHGEARTSCPCPATPPPGAPPPTRTRSSVARPRRSPACARPARCTWPSSRWGPWPGAMSGSGA